MMANGFQKPGFQRTAFQYFVLGRQGLGGDDAPRKNPNKGWNKDEWKRRVKDTQDSIAETLKNVYAELTAEPNFAVLAKTDAIVRPVAKVIEDKPLEIDFERLALNYERTNALIKLWQDEMDLRAAIDEEDDIWMLAV